MLNLHMKSSLNFDFYFYFLLLIGNGIIAYHCISAICGSTSTSSNNFINAFFVNCSIAFFRRAITEKTLLDLFSKHITLEVLHNQSKF